jgi:hypothetical protein
MSLCFCSWFFSIPAALVALITGAIGMARNENRSQCALGITCALVALGMTVARFMWLGLAFDLGVFR